MGKRERTAKCAYCKTTFDLPMLGRPPQCCSDKCRRAKRSKRAAKPVPEVRDDDLRRSLRKIRQHGAALEQALANAAADPRSVLQYAAALEKEALILSALATARTRDRSNQATWTYIGTLYGLSRTTASARFRRDLSNLSGDHAPDGSGHTPPGPPAPRPPQPSNDPPRPAAPKNDFAAHPLGLYLPQPSTGPITYRHCYFPDPLEYWPDTSTSQAHPPKDGPWRYFQYFHAPGIRLTPPGSAGPRGGEPPGLPHL
ncbi:hypothetical protein GCM10027168_44890 [Streptomyces capparidis]